MFALLLGIAQCFLCASGDILEIVDVFHHISKPCLFLLHLSIQIIYSGCKDRVFTRQYLIARMQGHKLHVTPDQFNLINHWCLIARSPQRQRNCCPGAAMDAVRNRTQWSLFHNDSVDLEKLVANHTDAGARGRAAAFHLGNYQASLIRCSQTHADSMHG